VQIEKIGGVKEVKTEVKKAPEKKTVAKKS